MATGTFPTATFTGAGGMLDQYINEVWSAKINELVKDKKHFANFFMDRSGELAGGGDTIHTGNITEMAAATKSNATAVTLNNSTDSNTDLVVNTWKEVSFANTITTLVSFVRSLQFNYAL